MRHINNLDWKIQSNSYQHLNESFDSRCTDCSHKKPASSWLDDVGALWGGLCLEFHNQILKHVSNIHKNKFHQNRVDFLNFCVPFELWLTANLFIRLPGCSNEKSKEHQQKAVHLCPLLFSDLFFTLKTCEIIIWPQFTLQIPKAVIRCVKKITEGEQLNCIDWTNAAGEIKALDNEYVHNATRINGTQLFQN